MRVVDRLLINFQSQFGNNKSTFYFKAPGRVNLIGEHTDYNDGFVLPFGINRHIHFLVRKREDRICRICSLNFNELREFKIDDISEKKKEGGWSDYIKGVVGEFEKKGLKIAGFEGIIYGDIPTGAGLASSAALEMAVACGLARINNLEISELELIRLCQRAENEFVGANCGIMDQYVCFYAKKGKALFLDTRTLSHQFISLPFKEIGVLVIDTKVKHLLASSEYNKRRKECEESVKLLKGYIHNLSSLRDLTIKLFRKYEKFLPQLLRKRVRHVLEENARVEEMVEALKRKDVKKIGELLFSSHYSLKDLYEVTSPETDFLVEIAKREGIIGARMTGGGFGGATIHLLFKEDMPYYRKVVKKEFSGKFGKAPGIFEVRTSQGARNQRGSILS